MKNASSQDATFGGVDSLTPTPSIANAVQATLFVGLATMSFAILIAVSGKWWILYHARATPWDEEREAKFERLEKWRSRLVLVSLLMMRFGFALFSVGIAVYLWDLAICIAAAVPVVTVTSTCVSFFACAAVAAVAAICSGCVIRTRGRLCRYF